jgi:hypothetical protein
VIMQTISTCLSKGMLNYTPRMDFPSKTINREISLATVMLC